MNLYKLKMTNGTGKNMEENLTQKVLTDSKINF